MPTPARAKVLTLDTKTNQILTITAEYGPVPAAPAPAAAPAQAPAAAPSGALPAAGGPPQGMPAWMRAPRAPMIPGSFQILVIGK